MIELPIKDEPVDDLEDGEIESDDDVPVIVSIIPPNVDLTKKLSSDGEVGCATGSSGITTNSKDRAGQQQQESHVTKNQSNKKSAPSGSLSKKSQSKRDDVRPDDDWMGNVENAIAMALKKDGIDPPPLPKLNSSSSNSKATVQHEHSSNKNEHRGSSSCGGSGSGSRSKKRKRRTRDREQSSKKHKSDDIPKRANDIVQHSSQQQPQQHQSTTQDDIDEYEMMCIRGGSPPPPSSSLPSATLSLDLPQLVSLQQTNLSGQSQRLHDEQYYSDDSYSSYGSYDSADRRGYDERRHRRRNNNKERRGGGIGGSRKSGRDKQRRRDNSDDDRGEPRGPRKMELCKFYLMECCAKRDKCLYMHSDFPCKYYYLGMKNHVAANCKFSHGKPLTDQLRNILLKHLETAPKEILGDFPRISRENATNMLNIQHQKLLKEHGMLPEIPAIPQLMDNATISKLPSLMELITEKPTAKMDKDKMDLTLIAATKVDKPRKTRWCDWTPSLPQSAASTTIDLLKTVNQIGQQQAIVSAGGSNSTSSSITPTPIGTAGSVGVPSIPSSGTPSYLSLRNLTGVITPEQIANLAALGIENLDQINQLTVAQLNQFGLDITQIHEIQLNAMNMQKLGLTSNAKTSTTVVQLPFKSPIIQTVTATTIIPTPTTVNSPASIAIATTQQSGQIDLKSQTANFYNEFGDRDQDMRIQHQAPNIVETSTIELDQKTDLTTSRNLPGSGDIDMRFLNRTQTDIGQMDPLNSTDRSHTIIPDEIILKDQQPSIIDYNQYLSKVQTDQPKFDYSQYLKDSNLQKTDLEEDHLGDGRDDGDDTGNSLVIEDEPSLQIDESWYSSDEDDINKNGETTEKKDQENDKQCNKPLPPVYDPSSIYPSIIMNKIDLSSSVSQYMNSIDRRREPNDDDNVVDDDDDNDCNQMKNTSGNADQCMDGDSVLIDLDTKLTLDMANKDLDDQPETTFVVSKNSASIVSRDPRKSLKQQLLNNSDTRHINDDLDELSNFEYFSRQNSEKMPQTVAHTAVETILPKPLLRTSIYEYPDIPIIDDDNSMISKDKDMRLSSLIIGNEMSSKGDIDLRLPFKPVMANFIPAKEIDASITSHAPIAYKVCEVDVPKPDYSEIRRNIPMVDEILDPRLRRILSIKELVEKQHQQLTNIDDTIGGKSDGIIGAIEIPTGPRLDPRRKNIKTDSNVGANANALTTIVGNSLRSTITSSTTGSSGTGNIDIQCILQKSIWYKDLSSKQKIMVNQQLALVSAELKKFHLDPNIDKIFDLTFIRQNGLLQQVLTNLGIFIDENGQFVQLPSQQPTSSIGPPIGTEFLPPNIGGAEMHNIPPMGMDYMRSNGPGPIGPGTQNMIAPNTRFMVPPNRNMMYGGGGGGGVGGGGVGGGGPTINDGRPSLLGAPPGIPNYNLYDNQSDVSGNYPNYDDVNPSNNGLMFDPQMSGGSNSGAYDPTGGFIGTGGTGPGFPSNNYSDGPSNISGGNGNYPNYNNTNNQRTDRGRNFRGGSVGGSGNNTGGSNGGNRGIDRWNNSGNRGQSNRGGNSGLSAGNNRRQNYDPRDWNTRRDKTKN